MKLQPHPVTVTAIHYSAYGEPSLPLSTLCLSSSVFQKVFLPSFGTGHVILSAGKDGVVAVSSLADGAVTRVIEDHRGAPVTTIHCVNEQVSSPTSAAAQVFSFLKDVSAITILQVVQRSTPEHSPSRIYISTTSILKVSFNVRICILKESSRFCFY